MMRRVLLSVMPALLVPVAARAATVAPAGGTTRAEAAPAEATPTEVPPTRAAPGEVAPAEVQRLTLADAVARALAASPALGQGQALERAAEADLRGARAGRLPQAELSLGYTRNSDVPELFLVTPGAPPHAIFPNIPDNYRTRLGVSVPVLTGGRTSALIDAAAGERAAAGADVRAATADIALETADAYWSLVTARDAEGVLTESLAAYEAHLRDARNRQAVGMAAANEVLAVQVERDRAELSRLRAGNAAAVAHANLARLVAAPPATVLEPAEPLATAPEPPAALEELVSAALASRPERAARLSRIGAVEARVRVERSARRPQVSAAAALDYANPNREILPPQARWDETWDVSLNLSWSVFDGGRASAAAAREEARAEAARQQLVDLERRIRLEVTQRRLDLDAARAAVEVAERNLEAARENRRVAAERYRAGVIPSSELLDAEVAQLQAGLDLTQALTDVRLAIAALARATGR